MIVAASETTLEIERVVAGGDGLARHESLVVFVPRTLGGERVNARIAVKGRFARGELVSIDRASDARVAPSCVHYDGDSCGGCQLQHAHYGEQLRIKSEIVVEAMRRIAHLEVTPPVVEAATLEWRYRRKLTLAIRRDAEGVYAGLRKVGEPDAVFSLHECSITSVDVLKVWKDVMAVAHHLPRATELRGAVRVDADGAASFALDGGDAWPGAKDLFEAVPALRSMWWTPDRGQRRRIATRDARPDGAPDASFAQVNESTASVMLEYVIERVRSHAPKHVIDGYAGVGDGAVAYADAGVRVTAIELDRDAAAWAAKRLPAPSRVLTRRVEDVLASALPADVVVLNPPRIGVDAQVCEILSSASRPPRAIVYVSCDPATLARDISRLRGWRIASLTCFDMFPQTAHVETVCELVRDAA